LQTACSSTLLLADSVTVSQCVNITVALRRGYETSSRLAAIICKNNGNLGSTATS
jgi:hypothetical protein